MAIEFHKYKKIYRLGHEENKDIFSNPDDIIVIQEKIDGGNFRFMINDGKVIIGSRTQQLTDDEGIDANMNDMFSKCAEFVRDKLKDTNLSLYQGLVFYGENCVKHTMNYDWDRMPLFLGFDILDLNTGEFLDHTTVKMIYSHLGLKTVPHIKTCKVSEIGEINDDMVPDSEYALESAEDKKAEGIVFKNYNKQIMAKYVRDKFKEKNSEAFGGTPMYNKVDDTNNAEFIFKYCTNQRIEKVIFKNLNEGNALDMRLMGSIIKETYEDIIEEEWRDILTSNWKLDFKKIRKLIAPRCRAVLEQIMVNNAR